MTFSIQTFVLLNITIYICNKISNNKALDNTVKSDI